MRHILIVEEHPHMSLAIRAEPAALTGGGEAPFAGWPPENPAKGFPAALPA